MAAIRSFAYRICGRYRCWILGISHIRHNPDPELCERLPFRGSGWGCEFLFAMCFPSFAELFFLLPDGRETSGGAANRRWQGNQIWLGRCARRNYIRLDSGHGHRRPGNRRSARPIYFSLGVEPICKNLSGNSGFDPGDLGSSTAAGLESQAKFRRRFCFLHAAASCRRKTAGYQFVSIRIGLQRGWDGLHGPDLGRAHCRSASVGQRATF